MRFWQTALCLLLMPLLNFAQNTHRLTIKPFKLNIDETSKNIFFSSISHISAHGNKLYISGAKEPYILELDLDAGQSRVFGAKGYGPGEFEQGVKAVQIDGQNIWAQDSSRPKRIVHFTDSGYQGEYLIYARGIRTSQTANTFAADAGRLVFPVSPKSRNLAAIYEPEKERQKLFGKLLFDESSADLLRACPDMNATLWTYGDGHWFGLFLYSPQIQKYDRNFNLVATIDLNHQPLLKSYNDDILEFKPEGPGYLPRALFTDVVFHKGELFVLGQPYLYQVNPNTGVILSTTALFGDKPEFKRHWGPLYFSRMAFLENGTLVLGTNVIAWDEELWQVKNPPFLNQPSKSSAGQ